MAVFDLLIGHGDTVFIQRVILAPIQPGDGRPALSFDDQRAFGGCHLLGAYQGAFHQGIAVPQLLVGLFGQAVLALGDGNGAAGPQQATGLYHRFAGDALLLLYDLAFHTPHGDDVTVLQQRGKVLAAIITFTHGDVILRQQLGDGAARHGAGGFAFGGHQCDRKPPANADPAVNQCGFAGGNGIVFLQGDAGTGQRLLGGIAAQRKGHTGFGPVGNV